MHQNPVYEVQIAGLPLKLRSSHDAQAVNELIHLVDETVKKALTSNPNISFQKGLLLALLHMAEDLLFLKRTALRELEGLEASTQKLLSELDASPLARLSIDP